MERKRFRSLASFQILPPLALQQEWHMPFCVRCSTGRTNVLHMEHLVGFRLRIERVFIVSTPCCSEKAESICKLIGASGAARNSALWRCDFPYLGQEPFL